MERGTVRVLSFRDRIRKTGVSYGDEMKKGPSVSEKLKNGWESFRGGLSQFFFGRAGPPFEPDFGDISPTHLRSPVVVKKIFDQAAFRYRYCGCVHIKFVTIFGTVLDIILIGVFLAVIALVAIDWRRAMEFEDEKARNGKMTVNLTEEPLLQKQLLPAQVYESYLVATIVDAALAIISIICLLYGMAKNRPNYLIPEICMAFVTVGVKILQLSKQASDGIATPLVIAVGVVAAIFSLWFAHVVFLYRRYMKDRIAFITAHTLY